MSQADLANVPTLQIYSVEVKWKGSNTTVPQVIYKPHCHYYRNCSPLVNGVYLTAIINKTPLRNENCPITNLISEMGVALAPLKIIFEKKKYFLEWGSNPQKYYFGAIYLQGRIKKNTYCSFFGSNENCRTCFRE